MAAQRRSDRFLLFGGCRGLWAGGEKLRHSYCAAVEGWSELTNEGERRDAAGSLACPWRWGRGRRGLHLGGVPTPILRSWLSRIPSYTVSQLRSLNMNIPQPGSREMIQATFSNRELMAMISGNRKTAALKRAFVRAFPHLQRRIQAARRPPIASRFIDSPSGPIVPPLWLADMFGPTMTRFSSSKARRVLGWKPSIDLGEAQQRSIRWLQYVRLVPDEDGS
jgi:hypothetical protein